MALAHSPRIVTDGLVLCLDAGNSKSYSGSGTTWNDISGNGNNGTLVNGVIFNGGLFDFDGVDDYISIPINLTNTTYTIIGIGRYKGTNNNRVITSNTGNWLMGWWAGQTNKYYAEGWVSPSGGGPVGETNWICYAATGNQPGDSWQLYRNGVLIVGPNAGGSNGPNGIRLGGWVSSERSACQVSYVSAYNRVLTAQEIQQNFTALRGRYGI